MWFLVSLLASLQLPAYDNISQGTCNGSAYKNIPKGFAKDVGMEYFPKDLQRICL
jgi:hypothetical protein